MVVLVIDRYFAWITGNERETLQIYISWPDPVEAEQVDDATVFANCAFSSIQPFKYAIL